MCKKHEHIYLVIKSKKNIDFVLFATRDYSVAQEYVNGHTTLYRQEFSYRVEAIVLEDTTIDKLNQIYG